MARLIKEWNRDCGCGRCPTWGEFAEYSCGCITVDIHNDRAPCDECTDFSGKRRRCGESGHPRGHAA